MNLRRDTMSFEPFKHRKAGNCQLTITPNDRVREIRVGDSIGATLANVADFLSIVSPCSRKNGLPKRAGSMAVL